MKTRKLGWTELELTEIGLGTWAMGGSGWMYSLGPQDDQLSVKTIFKAVDLGINWIDTAAVYGLGHAEEVVRQALQGLNTRPFIATKFSLRWGPDKKIYNTLKPESIREEAEQSLRRLGVEELDLYQMHWPVPDEELEEAWGEIAKLVGEGKVRYAGVCNFSIEQLRRIHTIYPVASLQSPYSLLRRGIEFGLLQYCQRNRIGVVVYSPMQKGLLTGKMDATRVKALPDEDRRRKDPNFCEPRLSKHIEFVKQLQEIASKYQRSVAELSIAWVLQKQEISSAIVGARRPTQITETACASGWVLAEDDLENIDRLFDEIYRGEKLFND